MKSKLWGCEWSWSKLQVLLKIAGTNHLTINFRNCRGPSINENEFIKVPRGNSNTPLILGWKKSDEKTHNSWINSYFAASEASISMRFSIFSLSIFLHSQKYKRFEIPMIKIRKEKSEFNKYHFSKWLTPQLKTFVLKKGTVQIGQKGVDSLSKRLIYISFIDIQVQIGLF